MKLSFEGELHSSANKKYKETILFVPFFAAKKSQLKRHIDFVNHLGYDAVIFNLKKTPRRLQDSLFSSKNLFGIKHIWADQIEELLNEIPGRKIIFAFSNTSSSAIEAIARRHASDISVMICDSGPSAELWKSFVNYFTFEQKLPTLPLRMAAASLTIFSWSANYLQDLEQDLRSLPESFKILSIRGWKDKLIPPNQIDKVFEPHPKLDWQKLSLPQAGHLNGLKDFSDEYTPAVSDFLTANSIKMEVAN